MRRLALALIVFAGMRPLSAVAAPAGSVPDVRPVPARAEVAPSPSRLGQRLHYHGMVRVPRGTRVRFETPRDDARFTWSEVRAGRGAGALRTGPFAGFDSVGFEATLQIFETGTIVVPGVGVQVDPLPGRAEPGRVVLPTVRVTVTPTLTAADSAAELRGLHGPLRAPWWERIPWRVVIGVLVALGLVLLLVRWWRRRKPATRAVKPVVAAAPTATPRLDPAAEALRALRALQERQWPQAGRFGEHALELTAILRRYLERTVATPRPGDTSGELLARLRGSRIAEADLQRLEALLALWDRVKFARAPLSVEEALRTEEAVESYVRREAQARLEAEAAARAAEAARAARTVPPPTASQGPRPGAA